MRVFSTGTSLTRNIGVSLILVKSCTEVLLWSLYGLLGTVSLALSLLILPRTWRVIVFRRLRDTMLPRITREWTRLGNILSLLNLII